MKNTVIGIDLHKKTSTYCVKDCNGTLLETDTFATRESNFKKLAFKYHGAVAVIEPVSESWHYGDVLEELGFEVKLAHSRHVSALGRVKVKTDTNDAELLCNLTLANILPEAYRSSKNMKDVKELVRMRYRLVRMRTRYKNIIHSILRKHGLKAPYQNMFGVKGMAWVKEQTDVFQVGTQFSLSLCIEGIDEFNQKIEKVEKEMEKIGEKDDRYEILTSFPGIGPIGALTIISEVENIARFKNAERFVSFCGLAPNVISSGDSLHFGRLRRGNPYLRFTFIQGAQHQKRLRENKGIRLFYEKERERREAKTATVATARKIAKIVHSMLMTESTFDQDKVLGLAGVTISTCA